jgi:HAD superfamily hydrolase (TIGR01509 family)
VDVITQWSRAASPAVIFDFNGTLSDDEPILLDIFSEVFRTRLGWAMTPEEYRVELLGRSDREIVEYAVRHHGAAGGPTVDELLTVRHAQYRQRVAHRSPITEDAVALVRSIHSHGIPMAIVTGAFRDEVLAVLHHNPVGPLIAHLVTAEDVTDGKPDPEGYLSGARLLDRDPADILVFEDSVPGVQAALAAGMHCIAVSTDPTPALRAVAPAIVASLSPALMSGALADRTGILD